MIDYEVGSPALSVDGFIGLHDGPHEVWVRISAIISFQKDTGGERAKVTLSDGRSLFVNDSPHRIIELIQSFHSSVPT